MLQHRVRLPVRAVRSVAAPGAGSRHRVLDLVPEDGIEPSRAVNSTEF
jgi:hypothetical protein